MNEIRLWATNISLVLILTGILMKTVSFESERTLLKFVATMLLIVSIFQLNTVAVKNEFDFEIKDEINDITNQKSSEFSKKLEKISINRIYKTADEIFRQYDENIVLDIKAENNEILIKFKSEIITNPEVTEIENKLEEYFECEFKMKRDDGIER